VGPGTDRRGRPAARGRPADRAGGAYQLQAAIAAVHAEAPRAADTDWAQIQTLYRLYAVHAHLLEMDGREGDARVAYATAARLATSIPEQRYLNDKAAPGEERHG
jgi:predicted RNA polymerase sigma factor